MALFLEAARGLGFGGRIVSGYLYNPDQSNAGTTHARAEIYVPGAGWITFDSTNREVGGFNLMSIAGSFVGAADAFEGMAVEVLVAPLSGAAQLPASRVRHPAEP